MNVSDQRRVVVTGVAAISPFGLTVEDLWSGLTEGRSAVGPLTAFSVEGLPLRHAAEASSLLVSLVTSTAPEKSQFGKALK